MEKDIGKITKNPDTEIIVRIDDFGGKVGLTIREFVKSERYTGFTKAGTRIPLDKISEFKKIVSSINEGELGAMAAQAMTSVPEEKAPASAASAVSASVSASAPAKKEIKKESKAKKMSAQEFEDAAF